MGTTKEEWIKTNRILRDDKPHDDDLKWLGTSKEDFFRAKRRIAWMLSDAILRRRCESIGMLSEMVVREGMFQKWDV